MYMVCRFYADAILVERRVAGGVDENEGWRGSGELLKKGPGGSRGQSNFMRAPD